MLETREVKLRHVTVGGIVLDTVLSADGDLNERGCGGNALYSAAGARLWNPGIAVLGRAAQDFPESYLEAFAQAGVDVSAVRRLQGVAERHSSVGYDENGQRTDYDAKPTSGDEARSRDGDPVGPFSYGINPKSAIEPVFDPMPSDLPQHFWGARSFHIAPMSYSAQLAFAAALNRRQVPFTIDPGRNVTSDEIRTLLELTPVFLPSEEDMVRMFGTTDLDRILEQLASVRPPVVVAKLGRQGSIVYDTHSERRLHVPVYPTQAKDPTGAGDAYCGGFLAGWTETGDVFEAALWATVSASFVVEAFDARYALRFSRAAAERRLGELRAAMA